jgi:cation:H+ antiporter
MMILAILAGFVLLIVGAELLVRGASRLAKAFGIPALIVGLTVVAFGTGAPEFAVSVQASVSGQTDICVGNVVGSNILNVLLILGLSALTVPLATSPQLVRLDVPVMIAASAAVWFLAADGEIGRPEGLALLSALALYTVLLVFLAKRQKLGPASDDAAESSRTMPQLALSAISVAAGLALLVLGSRWLVQGAVDLSRWLGVSELLIGLTIVSLGTSLPELATSVVAGIRGEREIAIGNVVGSNIFNILGVLGTSAAVAGQGMEVNPSALRFDIPIMTAVAVACLPVFFTGGRISRLEGMILVAYYAAYVTFLVLHATASPRFTTFTNAIVFIVIPLTLIGVLFSVLAATRQRRKRGDQSQTKA